MGAVKLNQITQLHSQDTNSRPLVKLGLCLYVVPPIKSKTYVNVFSLPNYFCSLH